MSPDASTFKAIIVRRSRGSDNGALPRQGRNRVRNPREAARPLRNLKREERRRSGGYNFGPLFYDEYFSQHPKGDDLAGALWDAVRDTKGGRTLFILDGLDEVSLDVNDHMHKFLKVLLNQQDVIITSRSQATFPAVDAIQLQLETIGFYPDQVRACVEMVFTDSATGETDSGTIDNIQSYLQKY